MTDIQQWRRMIQPMRTRTPARDLEDSDDFLSPTTPRKGLRPKFSSYFNQGTAAPIKSDPAFDDGLLDITWPPSCVDDAYPCPDAANLMEMVMCRLLVNPYNPLDPKFNCVILQIFESFRNALDYNKELLANLQEAIEREGGLEYAMRTSTEQFEREKREYKAEVKRLELILAKGKRGLAEVTFARQGSLLRQKQHERRVSDDRTMETIFEFLEKTKRYEDKVWSSQRAIMKTHASPSTPLKGLSKALTTRSHANLRSRATDTAMARLYSGITSSSFTESRPARRRNLQSEPKDSLSDDTFSTFSCAGDFLPDEPTDADLIEVAGTDNELVAVKRIANILAKRRHVDAGVVLPKLLDMFFLEPTSAASNATEGAKLNKKASMSRFFSRARPQLHINTQEVGGRRFSFEPGDDEASLSATPVDNLPAAVRDRLLRKTVSMSVLSETPQKAVPDSDLSPLPQSPTTSAPASDSKRASRIPTPTCTSLARPRQEREDSSASLLTAIKHSESGRSGSLTSSVYSSPSASRVDLTQGNILLEHTNALRGSVLGVGALKIDAEQGRTSTHETLRSLRQSRTGGYSRDENVAP